MIRGLISSVCLATATVASADPPRAQWAFESTDAAGIFQFRTEAVHGRLRCDGKNQGIVELRENRSDKNLVHGVGAMSLYRVFVDGRRLGDGARNWNAVGRLQADGSVVIDYPVTTDRPLRLEVRFRWTSDRNLDMTISLTPDRELRGVEVFLSSYFLPGMSAYAYVAPNQFESQPARFLAADTTPMIDGSYLMFPRDREAVQLIFDGRWELPPHPVRWAVARFMAAPLTLRRNSTTNTAVAMMSRPEDCFATAMPYNKTPPDGPAAHASLYHSIYGQDMAAGSRNETRHRLAILRDASDDEIIRQYQAFLSEAVNR